MNNLLDRITTAEKQLANAEKLANQLEGRLETLRESLKKITGEDEEGSKKIIKKWEIECSRSEKELDTLLTEIEEVIEQADGDENETED